MTLRHLDDRSYLTVEQDERYVLGPPSAPLLVLNDVDAFDCAWVADEPAGWAAPSVSTPVDRRQGGHGGFRGQPYFEERVLTVEGTVTAPSRTAMRAARDRLFGTVLGNLGRDLRYTHIDEQPSRGLWVVPASGQPQWSWVDDRCADFQFLLLAEDPLKTGDPERVGPVHPADTAQEGGREGTRQYAGGGRTYGGASTVAVTVAHVPNAGDEAAHAVYEVLGPISRPIISVGDDEYATVEINLTARDVLRIDTATGEVAVNGGGRYDAWGAGSTFPLIAAGGSEVRLRSATGQRYPDAQLYVTSAPTWK